MGVSSKTTRTPRFPDLHVRSRPIARRHRENGLSMFGSDPGLRGVRCPWSADDQETRCGGMARHHAQSRRAHDAAGVQRGAGSSHRCSCDGVNDALAGRGPGGRGTRCPQRAKLVVDGARSISLHGTMAHDLAMASRPTTPRLPLHNHDWGVRPGRPRRPCRCSANGHLRRLAG